MVGVYCPKARVLDSEGNEQKRVTVVGYALPVAKGVTFDLNGQWEKNERGTQYKLQNYTEVVASAKEAIIAYLSSGIIKGIGLGMAEKIYKEFGNRTMEILDKDSDRLLQVRGISAWKLKKIKDSLASSHGIQELMALLPKLSAPRAVKILNKFKSDAVVLAKENPYEFYKSGLISFQDVDTAAAHNGISPYSEIRLKAVILYYLERQEFKGDLCVRKKELIDGCLRSISMSSSDRKILSNAANELFKDEEIHVYGDLVFRDAADKAEHSVSSAITNLLSFGGVGFSENLSANIFELEEMLGISLSQQQKRAVECSLNNNLSIITGGPGTGKTQVLQFILQLYQSEYPDNEILCCAPTGRAARRMEEATGLPASTIHSALTITAKDNGELTEAKAIDAGLIVVDEASMLDMYLAQRLFEAISYDNTVILVGDADQLPSVGPGAVLSEMIASGEIPVTRLNTVFRQKTGSLIASNAAFIRNNNIGLEYSDDFQLVESPYAGNSAAVILEAYMKEVDRYGVDNVTILVPFRRKLETGVEALNLRIRAAVNPSDSRKSELAVKNKLFRVGDKVMQTKNEGEINNGDIGYIKEIITEGKVKKALVEFDAHRLKSYGAAELISLELGYVTTVHKSQGSEYKSVIINLQNAHNGM